MRGTETRSNSRRHFHLEQKPRRKAIQHFQWLGKPFPMRSAMWVCLLNSSSPLTHVHLKSIPYKVLVTQQGLNPQCENYFSDPFLKREKEKDREAEAQLRLCTREEGVPALALSLERGRSAPRRQHQLTSFQTYEAPSGPAAFPSSPPPTDAVGASRRQPIPYSFYCSCTARRFFAPGTFYPILQLFTQMPCLLNQ